MWNKKDRSGISHFSLKKSSPILPKLGRKSDFLDSLYDWRRPQLIPIRWKVFCFIGYGTNQVEIKRPYPYIRKLPPNKTIFDTFFKSTLKWSGPFVRKNMRWWWLYLKGQKRIQKAQKTVFNWKNNSICNSYLNFHSLWKFKTLKHLYFSL